ncbi:UNVERIFIED_CONTAM: putative transposon Ty5-1 protein, partial [Sesamum indicum]
LSLKLTEFGFTQSAYDHCFFTKMTDTDLLALLVYVDNIVVTAPSLDLIQSIKLYLHSLFTIKDLGDARYFLGLKIARNSDDLYLAQTKYVQDIIRDIGMLSTKSVSTPFPLRLKLSDNCGPLHPQPDQYRRAALHVLGYLKGEQSKGLFFPSQSSFELTVYCDADRALCTDSRHSLLDTISSLELP